jgi:DNA-binding response OmpR family regulator
MVEDDAKLAAAVARGLEAESFAVEVAGDGDTGLWMAAESTYDAIVLDLMLPRRNGYQVCAALRARGDWTPVLVLTAKDGDLDEAEALDTGADDFLSKPFSFTVLVARLHALVRRSLGPGTGAALEVGDLLLDPRSRTCRRGDREIALTAREFDVLTFLVRRAGEVLSKRDVLDGVWDHDFDGDPNIVEVYVRRLRRKVDEPFAVATIQTMRGAGYRIVP